MEVPVYAECPQCKKRLKTTPEMTGKVGKCAVCGHKFVVELPVTVEPVDRKEFDWSAAVEPPPEPPPKPVPVARPVAREPGDMKCPFCASAIPGEAKICRRCGETVDPALREAREAKRDARDALIGGPAPRVVYRYYDRYYRRSDFGPWHAMHAILTVFTCGAWLPIWLVHWIIWETC